MPPRSRTAAFLAAAFLATLAALPAAAQDAWPTRPITMVVPFAAGSSSDVAGRVLAARMSEVLGQQVIIENIGGGGGMTGTARVAKAAPDGYQFVFASVDSMAIVPTMHKRPLYDSVKDFAAAGLVVEQPIVLVTRKDLPVTSLQDFVAHTKANHKQMQFGSSGVGSGSHFSCAQLNAKLGIDPQHVPYRGSGLAMQDLIGGRIDYFCALGAAAMGPVESGTAKPIALLTNERSPLFPTLKTAKEQGIGGVDSYFWTAFFFPKGTPDPIVKKLYDATSETLKTPVVVERLQKAGVTVIAPELRTPQYLSTFVGTEVEKWGAMIKASGITIE
ncbi:MAG: tripartite tricarboxylate transporter substrate binding protein [Xanthobacteraceae bacterium]|nr:tripartite tricarboxylate transporter substrate binding protein [Xanthobacteraceae bacterium]